MRTQCGCGEYEGLAYASACQMVVRISGGKEGLRAWSYMGNVGVLIMRLFVEKGRDEIWGLGVVYAVRKLYLLFIGY